VNNRIQRITCLVRCESAESLRAATEVVERLNQPDTVIPKTFITLPGEREERLFRMGDYFDKIELKPSESGDSASFSLLMYIGESASSFWKDLLMEALQTLRECAPGVRASIVPGGAKTI
jgi:hypothetical protein